MRIGIDASRATVARRTGTEHYAWRLVQELLALGLHHDFTLYLREPPPAGLFNGGMVRPLPFPRLWTHVRLAGELLLAPPQVFFVPAHVIPLVTLVPSVVTVHDLGYRHFPQAHPLRQRLYLEWSTWHSARTARRVIADSVATQRDLSRFYHIPPEKIKVVYPGYDDTLRPTDPAQVRAKYQLPATYFFHLGTLQPRKNLLRLIEAFLQLQAQLPQAQDCALVLAGRPGWLSGPILAKAQAHAAQVRLLDYAPDADLPGLYSGAAALVYPSLYEGFGFPVLEAMACGTPVICANTSSLPELVGEAALQVNPLEVAEISTAMQRVLTDPTLRASLVERGFAQLKRFGWATTAEQVLGTLEEVGQGRG